MKKISIALFCLITGITQVFGQPIPITSEDARTRLRANETNKRLYESNPKWAKDFDKLLETGECENCNLDGVDLENMIVKKGGKFGNSSFKNADLRGMVWSGAELKGTQFDGSKMNSCQMEEVNCTLPESATKNTSFKGTLMSNVHAPGSRFDNADFTDANLYMFQFYDENYFRDNPNNRSNLQGATFNNTNLTFTNFCQTNMANCKGISVTILRTGGHKINYPPSLYIEPNQVSTAVFCSTLMPNTRGGNTVVTQPDCFAGGSWCNCSRSEGYQFVVKKTGKVIKQGPFDNQGVSPLASSYITC